MQADNPARRTMSDKWLPNGDMDFKTKAQSIARNIAEDPARFEVSDDESTELSALVARFGAALQECRWGSRSRAATLIKEEARADAEKLLRRLGNMIRMNPRIAAATKVLLDLHERTKKTTKLLLCPQEPPRLKFK